jgi:hypothetical protein
VHSNIKPLIPDPPIRRNWMFWLRLTWLVGLLLLAAIAVWIVIRYSLPQPNMILVGSVQDYQEGMAPRLFWDEGTPFYVLQTDGGLIALTAYSRRWMPCLIRWDAERGRFIDPCWGSRMLPNGAYEDGPPWEMEHLPLLLLNGDVWVETGYR